MQFYTFAAFTILAITMGQISQTHADIKPELTDEPKVGLIGGPQISAGTDALRVNSSTGSLGILTGEIVEIFKEIVGEDFLKTILQYEENNDNKDDNDVVAMNGLSKQYGGNITLEVQPLAEFIPAIRDMDADKTRQALSGICDVTQIRPDTLLLLNNFSNIQHDILVIQRSLDKELENQQQQENPSDQQ